MYCNAQHLETGESGYQLLIYGYSLHRVYVSYIDSSNPAKWVVLRKRVLLHL